MKRFLEEDEARALLREYSIGVPEGSAADGDAEALGIARKLGYPVILRALEDDVPHWRVETEDDLRAAYHALVQDTGSRVQGKRVLVQKVPEGKEVTVGLLRDPGFGVAVSLSLGGLFSEILGEISYGMAPLDKEGVLKMMEEIGADGILGNGEMERLGVALARVSELAMDKKEIIEMDIKLVVHENGVVAVDSRAIVG